MSPKSNAAAYAPVLQLSEVDGRDDALTHRWMRVSEAVQAQASGNAKLHDIGSLALSILENGFIDPPKWDSNLNNGQGGIVYGNGRLEAVAYLEDMHCTGQQINGRSVTRPRGVGLERATGAWAVLVAFGVDAATSTQAERLLIDHNNLTLAGTTFTALDMAKMYDREAYRALLSSIEGGLGMSGDERLVSDGQLTLTVDTDDFALLCKVLDEDDGPLDLGASGLDSGLEGDEYEREPGEPREGFAAAKLTLAYGPEHFAEVEQLINQLMRPLDATNPADCVLKALRETATSYAQPREAL